MPRVRTDRFRVGDRIAIESCSHLGHEIEPGTRGVITSVFFAPGGHAAVTVDLDAVAGGADGHSRRETRTLLYPLDRFRRLPSAALKRSA